MGYRTTGVIGMVARNWKCIGRIGEYAVWQADDIYNVTSGDVPLSSGGYYDLNALLALKGLRRSDMEEPPQPLSAPRR